jgi:hypothetical protein
LHAGCLALRLKLVPLPGESLTGLCSWAMQAAAMPAPGSPCDSA